MFIFMFMGYIGLLLAVYSTFIDLFGVYSQTGYFLWVGFNYANGFYLRIYFDCFYDISNYFFIGSKLTLTDYSLFCIYKFVTLLVSFSLFLYIYRIFY